MRDFIGCAGFVGLVNAFGWPSVRSWPAVITLLREDDISLAKFATREIRQIAPFTDLAELQRIESQSCLTAFQEEHAVLAFSAFEPTTWTMVRFRLWQDSRMLSLSPDIQAYNVLHVSNPPASNRE